MKVFVLCTGRCGSVTFARACEHFTNYTVGHETAYRELYFRGTRFMFLGNHIEIDPRSAFYLGPLEEEHGKDAFYVHLTRDPRYVAASYLNKLNDKGMGIGRAWWEITGHAEPDHLPRIMFDMVQVINSNIRAFLRDKDHMTIDIADAAQSFPEFAARIGADGDIEAACAEFSVRHNAGSEI